MSRQPSNLAASIQQRLRNGARERGEDPQFVLQRYAAERFLYRLGQSTHREDLVLKGAMLFSMWGGSLYRPTRDLDFTGYGDDAETAVLQRIRDICSIDFPGDGITFDLSNLRAKAIREEIEYGGLRVEFSAILGAARVPMQIDVGFGNAIEPGAEEAEYPSLLDAPAPRIRAYPTVAVVAEKLNAMVVIGERNSRLKDFYDLFVLSTQFEFDRRVLTNSICATFERRQTKIEQAIPVALTARFYADEGRAQQWRSYLKRSNLPNAPADFDQVGERLRSFLLPIWRGAAMKIAFNGHWQPGGGWKDSESIQPGGKGDD